MIDARPFAEYGRLERMDLRRAVNAREIEEKQIYGDPSLSFPPLSTRYINIAFTFQHGEQER
jgi:hypothetical protein